jgi:hypothetical protein
MRNLLVVSLIAALFAACAEGGDEEERVLHLRTGDYTESRVRAEIRAANLNEDTCNALDGRTASEVLDMINRGFDSGENPRPAIQEADPEDDLRQAEIFIEECARLY